MRTSVPEGQTSHCQYVSVVTQCIRGNRRDFATKRKGSFGFDVIQVSCLTYLQNSRSKQEVFKEEAAAHHSSCKVQILISINSNFYSLVSVEKKPQNKSPVF